MKLLLITLTIFILNCTPCLDCVRFTVDQEQLDRWHDNNVKIHKIDTLDNNLYKVYIK